MLGRGLHIQGTRWHGLLLCMVNSPSLLATAAPRRERQICLVGTSRGVGFAQILDKMFLAYCSGRRLLLSCVAHVRAG